jgi:hypothetical protein
MGRCRATGKRRYQDRLDAMIALASAQASKHSARRDEKRIYHCPHCGGWHLTAQEKRGKR